MTARRLTAVDAQMYWMSASIPNDQFLLYAFDGSPEHLGRALGEVRTRAQCRPEFGLRIADSGVWTYPVWEPRAVDDEQFVVHELTDATWQGCLDAVARLTDSQLDARQITWRLHVFPGLDGVPGAAEAAVTVLQISHALGDGVRASALAAYLFGRDAGIPTVCAEPAAATMLPVLACRAARAHRRLERDVCAGLTPPQAVSVPALRSNSRPAGARHLRTVVCGRDQFGAATVTAAALAAVSAALAGQLRALGDDPARLGAEVPMAKAGNRQAFNHFGNVGVGLYPGLDRSRRVDFIAADLRQRRRRAAHPAAHAQAAAFAAVPASLLRWGVGQFNPEVRSATVTGNTVVSSVNRGAKDLRFGAAPVALTAGFPALSPMMAVTHGVHGIGDTVVVSVHAADSGIGDIDTYAARLARELRGSADEVPVGRGPK